MLGPLSETTVDISVKLEQRIVDYLPGTVYDRRVQLCGGKAKANNGLAMWGRLHQDFAGEGEAVEHAGVEVLRENERCNKLSPSCQVILTGGSNHSTTMARS